MIPTIPTPEEILDKGFSRGKKQADLIRSQKIPKHLKGKRIEERRVVTSCQVIKDKLKSILDAVPEIEELHPFYQDYIDITVGVDDMKQALGALNWAYGIITQLEKEYGAKIRKNPSEKATAIQKQAYGRISSVINKIKKDLDFLDFAKQNLRNMPTIDFDATTILVVPALTPLTTPFAFTFATKGLLDLYVTFLSFNFFTTVLRVTFFPFATFTVFPEGAVTLMFSVFALTLFVTTVVTISAITRQMMICLILVNFFI